MRKVYIIFVLETNPSYTGQLEWLRISRPWTCLQLVHTQPTC